MNVQARKGPKSRRKATPKLPIDSKMVSSSSTNGAYSRARTKTMPMVSVAEKKLAASSAGA